MTNDEYNAYNQMLSFLRDSLCDLKEVLSKNNPLDEDRKTLVELAERTINMLPTTEVHPIQLPYNSNRNKSGLMSSAVTLRAYDVYCSVCSPQPELVTGGCRGGFGVGELITFLYARSFPEGEWEYRVKEASKGMHLGDG